MIYRLKPVKGGWRIYVGTVELTDDRIIDLQVAIAVASNLAREEVARGTPGVQVVVKEPGLADRVVAQIGKL